MARAPQISIAAALVLALLASHAPEAGALPREKDRWIQVDTANFTLFSNASTATVRGIAKDLEQFRAVVSQLTIGDADSSIPTLLYVFLNDRDFRPYKPLRDGKPAVLSSLFQAREHAYYISTRASIGYGISRAVYSMYAYRFLHDNAPCLPPWLGKGLSEYYGTVEIEPKHTNIGKPNFDHIRRLRARPSIDVAELFATERHPGYGAGEAGHFFDARSWVVVHYLLTADPERHRQTVEFIRQLERRVPQDTAFEKAFKTTYAELQRELTAYLRRPTFGYLRFQLARVTEEEMRIKPMSHADVLYRLGDLLLNEHDLRPEAGEHFRAALRENPQHALALAGLGRVADRQERHETALEYFRKAAALAPDDFVIQYRYGVSLLKDGDGSRAVEAQRAVGLSVAANPGFAPAWAQLAYAYTFEDEPPPNAISAAETAHRMLPARKDVAKNLLLLYTRVGLREPAQALIDRVFVPNATPEELAEAQELLKTARSRREDSGT